jgi:SAM-dependent methyltransferase
MGTTWYRRSEPEQRGRCGTRWYSPGRAGYICHAEGRGFESHHPLPEPLINLTTAPKRQSRTLTVHALLASRLTLRVGKAKIGRVPPYRLLYRLGLTPWDNAPGAQLLDRVLAGDSTGAGRRALDVGCGKGRDAIHLAKRGWEVTAVDLEERAIAKARERAAEADAHVRWIIGDVTKLGTLAAPPGYSLIYDLGCIQGLPDQAAALAAEGITALAAEDAALLFLAFARGRRRILPRGMDRDHVEALFAPAWRLTGTHDVLQLSDHGVPPPIRKAGPTAYHLVKA